MNTYNLLVITGTKTYNSHKVKADGLAWSDAGLYEFWKIDKDGMRISVAYYPVSKTIIEKIEYNTNESK